VISVGGDGCRLLLLLVLVMVLVLLDEELDCSCDGGLVGTDATLDATGLTKSRVEETGGVGKFVGVGKFACVAVAVAEVGGIGKFAAAILVAVEEDDVVRED